MIPEVSRSHCVVAGAIGALAAGFIWSFAYGVGSEALLVLCTLHALGGGLLGIALHAKASKLAPASLASGLAAWSLAMVVPTLTGFWVPASAGNLKATLVALFLAAVVLVLSIGIARLGQMATGLAMTITLLAAFALSGSKLETVLEPRPVADVSAGEAAAPRLAIIGLDSADWRVIDPLIAKGELPNLAALIRRGQSAELVSMEPSDSPVVWTTIFSGREPREHGIVDWATAHAANRRTVVLWEMLASAGDASVVVNVPGSWPPTKIEGAMVAGFPMPSALLRPDRDQIQNVGSLVALAPREGPLRTTVAQPDADGSHRAQVSLGRWLPRAHTSLRHFAIELANIKGWLPAPDASVDIVIGMTADDGSLEIGVGPHALSLAARSASPWLEIDSPAGPLQIQVHRVDGDLLWVTPAFQSPGSPLHPYTSTSSVRDVVAELGMYAVEPTGWRSVDEPAVRPALFRHLVDVEQQHLQSTLALMDAVEDWRLLVHIITLPDRTSHAFWPYHEPEAYPGLPAKEVAASRDTVADAYRESDRLLGELFARLGSRTTILIASDHGTAASKSAYGGHRTQGIFIAAGPGVAKKRERLDMSILDVTPVALSLLGLPAAEDLKGSVPQGLLTGNESAGTITTYEVGGAQQPAAKQTIDESTREQLRGLGYLE